jgi:hypothetical protein
MREEETTIMYEVYIVDKTYSQSGAEIEEILPKKKKKKKKKKKNF